MGKKSNKSSASSTDDKKKSKLISFKVRSLNDNVQPFEIRLDKSDFGSKLFDQYCQHICPNGKFVEKDYFGLRYTDKTKQRQWLEMEKSAFKQLSKSETFGLSFRVKHYPRDPVNELTQKISKYLFYLQIRRDLTQGRLICTDREDQARVGAAIFQAEIGDSPFDSVDVLEKKMKEFLDKTSSEDPIEFVKDLNVIYEERYEIKYEMAKKHIDFKGLTKQEAEKLLLNHVSSFHTYGIDPFLVDPLNKEKGSHKSSATKDYIGLTDGGIMTFIETKKNKFYPWEQISDIMLDGSKFMFTFSPEKQDDIPKTGTLKLKKKDKNKEVIKYECFSKESAMALWKWTLDRKSFFTLMSAKEVKEFHSKKSLFSRGKSFKFSGHSKFELKNKDAPDPDFIRTTSFKRSHFINENLPNLNYRSTMPSKTRANITAFINENQEREKKDLQLDQSQIIKDKPAVKRPGVSISLKQAVMSNYTPVITSTSSPIQSSAIPSTSVHSKLISEDPFDDDEGPPPSVIEAMTSKNVSDNLSMPKELEIKANMGRNLNASISPEASKFDTSSGSQNLISPSINTNVNSASSSFSPIGLMQQTEADVKRVGKTSPNTKVQGEVVINNPRVTTKKGFGNASEDSLSFRSENDAVNMIDTELDRFDPKRVTPSGDKSNQSNGDLKNRNNNNSSTITNNTKNLKKLTLTNEKQSLKNGSSSSRGSSCAKSLAILSFLLLLVAVFIIVMESKSFASNQNPIIDYAKDLREQPMVKDFAERFYQPAKDGANKMIKNLQGS